MKVTRMQTQMTLAFKDTTMQVIIDDKILLRTIREVQAKKYYISAKAGGINFSIGIKEAIGMTTELPMKIK